MSAETGLWRWMCRACGNTRSTTTDSAWASCTGGVSACVQFLELFHPVPRLHAQCQCMATSPSACCHLCSVVGETKTTASGHLREMTFAQVSCSNCEAAAGQAASACSHWLQAGDGQCLVSQQGASCTSTRRPRQTHPCLLCTLPGPNAGGFGRFHAYDLAARVDGLDFVLHCG